MRTDGALLHEYVSEGSETAFAELVHRHVHLVHSAALRHAGGDVHRAQDITQAVFSELARNARRLTRHPALSGWLYTTARFIGSRMQRADSRRVARERTSQSSAEMQQEPAVELAWHDVGPVLDEAMAELNERDRTAIVLRYFQNKPLAEVGTGLGITANAARMRVDRAIERLRSALRNRGVTSTSSALGAALMANAVSPAPASLAAALVGPAMAGAALSAGTIPLLTVNLLQIMNSAKIAAGVAAVAVTGLVGTYVHMDRANAELRAELAESRAAPVPTPAAEAKGAAMPDVGPEELARAGAQHSELLRLRGEVGVLRKTTDELARALREKSQAAERAEERMLALQKSRAFVELMGSAKMNYLRGWFVACQSFAQQNAGRMPLTLDEAEAHFDAPKGWEWTTGFMGKVDFEIVHRGSLEGLEHPERTIVVREKEPSQVQDANGTRVSRAYGFADGHTEIHFSADGDFERWERERMVAQSNEASSLRR